MSNGRRVSLTSRRFTGSMRPLSPTEARHAAGRHQASAIESSPSFIELGVALTESRAAFIEASARAIQLSLGEMPAPLTECDAAGGDRSSFENSGATPLPGRLRGCAGAQWQSADAEDLVHDAIVRAAERLESCRQRDI